MKNKFINYAASLALNVLVVFLYYYFIGKDSGTIGLVYIYVIAWLMCIYIYSLRYKELIIDATLGPIFLASMVYALIFKRSWQLMAEIMFIAIIIFSISSFYFDWSRLDKRR